MKMKRETYREHMEALEKRCKELEQENQKLRQQPDIFDYRQLDEIIGSYRTQSTEEVAIGNGIVFDNGNGNKSLKMMSKFMEEYKKYRQLTASLYQNEIRVDETELLKKLKHK